MGRWCVLVCGLLLSGAASAQFEIGRFVIAGGGGQSSGGAWSLSGTVGQSDADVVPLCSSDGTQPGLCAGASFELVGGFWAGVAPAPPHPSCADRAGCLFLDGFEPLP